MLPTLDFATPTAQFLRELDAACQSNGFFYLKHHGISPALLEEVLVASNRFFDLDAGAKTQVHIDHSSNFRGYSEMKNDRDWREQIHFGQELPEIRRNNQPEWYKLTGPNLWPEALGDDFQHTMLDYLAAANAVGQKLLAALASCLNLPDGYFQALSNEEPYLLMKLICYYPQPNTTYDRPGVAAHCDWSWLTILHQDEIGGLEVWHNGAWQAVTPIPGTVTVNIGELLEIITKGRYKAAPHRVINPSEQSRRVSIPVFINPALDAMLSPVTATETPLKHYPEAHVHRVKAPGNYPNAIHFGASEWARKGLGGWCWECC